MRIAAMTRMGNDNEFYRVFSRIVIGVLGGFVLIILSLAILFSRSVSLQESIEDDTSELMIQIEELQETTQELQETLDTLNDGPLLTEQIAADLPWIDQQLEEIDAGLENIEQNIEDISGVTIPPEPGEDYLQQPAGEVDEIQEGINQIFVFITWLIGGLSFVTAIIFIVIWNREQGRHRVRLDDLYARTSPSDLLQGLDD
jgi:cell division protein FtsB